MVTPDFVRAGHAIFTATNGAGEHRTYKVLKTDPARNPGDSKFKDPAWFLYALTGSDNEDDYTYVGLVKLRCPLDPIVKLTKASRFGVESPIVKIGQWALRAIWQVHGGTYRLPDGYDIKHVGKCGKCGRTLTTPESLDTGFGPECADQLGIEWGERTSQLGLPGATLV